MTGKMTRRDFASLGGVAALGAATSQSPRAAAASVDAANAPPRFPNGFFWGVATASYQIEGSPDADGKGESIWDVYAHTPGKMRNGDTGDVAIDHYKRYREDVAVLKGMGVNAYRLSISWPRIFPQGTGKPNRKGLAFYDRLADELLSAGIQPFPTLYHWDLPQALQDKGGWQSRETAMAFGDYAASVTGMLSDRVKHFFTINEFKNFVIMGHQGKEITVQGKPVRFELAPGLKLSNAEVNQVAHHSVLAHGLAVQATRAHARPGTKVGPAEAFNPLIPAIDSPEHVRATEIATREENAAYLTVMLEGKYTEHFLATAGRDAPKFTEADLKIISSPVDFVGINVYTTHAYCLASSESPGYELIETSVSHPKMKSSWHTLAPEALYWAPRQVASLWNPREIYITENGCAAADALAEDGHVYDTDRVMYLRNGLMHLQRAVHEGIPVRGNFCWSAMDNLEWTDGYGTRFGLVYVDFQTQKRIPKLSAAWYREAARRNAVV